MIIKGKRAIKYSRDYCDGKGLTLSSTDAEPCRGNVTADEAEEVENQDRVLIDVYEEGPRRIWGTDPDGKIHLCGYVGDPAAETHCD